jgi:hypothetical protein
MILGMMGMHGCRIVELSFANKKIYKKSYIDRVTAGECISSINQIDKIKTRYFNSNSKYLDELYPFFSKNENGIVKYYHPSNDIYKIIEGRDSEKGKDLKIYDLCPAVDLWIGVGTYSHTKDDFELYFAIDTDQQLRNLSEYYNLSFPLPEDESLDCNIQDWHSMDFRLAAERINPNCRSKFKNNFKIGSIKFRDDSPSLLKMYKSNHKDKDYAKQR